MLFWSLIGFLQASRAEAWARAEAVVAEQSANAVKAQELSRSSRDDGYRGEPCTSGNCSGQDGYMSLEDCQHAVEAGW